MRQDRSATQILFGYLPDQTVDLEGGVWRVRYWQYPVRHPVDDASIRDTLVNAVRPWEPRETDNGLGRLLRSGHDIAVLGVDRRNGVRVAPFPEQWRCKSCHRVENTPTKACRCGTKSWGQLPFVAYCGGCGALDKPYFPTCEAHRDVALQFPASASAREIRFVCPVCKKLLRKGFGYSKCRTCGEMMSHNVHRAASVYTARTLVMVNAPSPERVRRLRASGGPTRALRWVLDGMATRRPSDSVSGVTEIRHALEEQGLPAAAIEAALAAMKDQPGIVDERPTPHSPVGEGEALAIALALDEERVTLSEFTDNLLAGSPLHDLHSTAYPASLSAAGVARVDLTTRFPLLTGVFGYTRGDTAPGVTTLVPYRDRDGTFVVYGDLQATEAWFVGLDPVRVLHWLRRRGHRLDSPEEPRLAREAVLSACVVPAIWEDPPEAPTVGSDVQTLVHSYAHRLIRTTTSLAGIDRDALSEYLVPASLGFFLYAAAKGDFVLGGLEAVFEQDLNLVFDRVAQGDDRCALDPGCTRHGGACVACLHLGEPSCRGFNRYLNRGALRSYLSGA